MLLLALCLQLLYLVLGCISLSRLGVHYSNPENHNITNIMIETYIKVTMWLYAVHHIPEYPHSGLSIRWVQIMRGASWQINSIQPRYQLLIILIRLINKDGDGGPTSLLHERHRHYSVHLSICKYEWVLKALKQSHWISLSDSKFQKAYNHE